MNELSTKTERKMTTREVAEALGCAVNTVRETAKEVLPDKVFENGKTTYWTESEVTVVLEALKNHNGNQNNLSGSLTGVSTSLTPALKIKQAMLLMQEGYEEEIARLESENKQLQIDYQNEREEHQKDKELVLHKYLTATQIKETIWKEYGKNIVVSKAVKRIPLEDNDILYKPFKNGNFTGQQPVYHPNVLDKIREILG